jgi:hypothetical protein
MKYTSICAFEFKNFHSVVLQDPLDVEGETVKIEKMAKTIEKFSQLWLKQDGGCLFVFVALTQHTHKKIRTRSKQEQTSSKNIQIK